MIDRVIAEIPQAADGFVMDFRAHRFPAIKYRLEWRRAESSGNVYTSPDLDAEGWLRPALFRYFSERPPNIYVRVKPKAWRVTHGAIALLRPFSARAALPVRPLRPVIVHDKFATF